ncbi:MAG: archease [Armatimonadetes bacterium]|nr:archease [Armatimonadota bacterium]
MGYEILEHTADQAIRATGRDLRELIENAAAGMLALLYSGTAPSPRYTLELSVAADAPEMVLHHALRELLYLLEDEGLAPVIVRVTSADAERAALRVGVIPRDQAEPLLGTVLKAVTRHGLAIEEDGGVLRITIVFDV